MIEQARSVTTSEGIIHFKATRTFEMLNGKRFAVIVNRDSLQAAVVNKI